MTVWYVFSSYLISTWSYVDCVFKIEIFKIDLILMSWRNFSSKMSLPIPVIIEVKRQLVSCSLKHNTILRHWSTPAFGREVATNIHCWKWKQFYHLTICQLNIIQKRSKYHRNVNPKSLTLTPTPFLMKLVWDTLWLSFHIWRHSESILSISEFLKLVAILRSRLAF